MSLFKWSTPERRKGGQILPIIPNEIYIYIFEYIALPTGSLAPEELEIFTNLSRVCRFFANFCLPRIFEFVQFSGSTSCHGTPTGVRNNTIYRASREATLCTQIAAKQPLALSLAERVRVCHFTDWNLTNAASWAVQLFAQKYIAGMSHMKNIRNLKFLDSFVGAEHWSAIGSLESLEELSFDCCHFLKGPTDVEHEGKVKVKISRLRVVDCIDYTQPIARVDFRYLRTLSMNAEYFNQTFDWLSQSALTELHCFWQPYPPSLGWYLEQMRTILLLAPQSVEALWLCVDTRTGVIQDKVRSLFDEPAWENLPLLRSLTLQVVCQDLDMSARNVLSFVLDCISPLADLQSFTLKKGPIAPKISPTEVLHILRDMFGSSCRLKYAEICGQFFRLVGGKWTEVSCNTAK